MTYTIEFGISTAALQCGFYSVQDVLCVTFYSKSHTTIEVLNNKRWRTKGVLEGGTEIYKEGNALLLLHLHKQNQSFRDKNLYRGNEERQNNINSNTIYRKHAKLALLFWIYPVNVSHNRSRASVRIAMGKQQTLIYFRWSKCPA